MYWLCTLLTGMSQIQVWKLPLSLQSTFKVKVPNKESKAVPNQGQQKHGFKTNITECPRKSLFTTPQYFVAETITTIYDASHVLRQHF